MTSIFRRRGSKIWTAFFRDHNGRQHCISTKETDKSIAIAIAQEWEKAAWRKRSMRQTQRVIDRLHELIGGERIARLSVREYAASWLKTKKPETARSTQAFYASSIGKFLSYLGPRADLPITEIGRADLLGYRSSLVDKLQPKTVNHDLKTAKMLFRAAKRDAVIADDPAEFIETVKNTAPRAEPRRPFTQEELKAVLGVADAEWRSMIAFGLYTGQRLGDIAKLTWKNLDLSHGKVRLTTSKTGKDLIIPMAEPLLRHVKALRPEPDQAAPVHPRAFGLVQSQGKSGGLSNQFADVLAAAGLRPRQPHRTKVGAEGRSGRRSGNALSFHSLRRTATTWMHEAGIPQAVVQALIGHDSEAMHQLYITVGEEAVKRAGNTLPDVLP